MRTQDLEPAFHYGGQFYFGRIAAWLESSPLADPHSVCMELGADRAVDIDEPEDCERAERLAGIACDGYREQRHGGAAVFVAIAACSIAVSSLVGPRRPNTTKLGPYESGNEPLADVPGTRFWVKSYMVAILFLTFDVKAVFVYLGAVVLRQLGLAGLWPMMVFLRLHGVEFV